MFDPYHKWLGIPKKDRPVTFYRLLGIDPEEDDLEVVNEAAIRQTAHLRTYQNGPHSELCTKLLNHVALARETLLNPAKRKVYDQRLAQQMGLQPGQPSDQRLAPAQPPSQPFGDLANSHGGKVIARRSDRKVKKARSGSKISLLIGLMVALLGLVGAGVSLFIVLILDKTPDRPSIVEKDKTSGGNKVLTKEKGKKLPPNDDKKSPPNDDKKSPVNDDKKIPPNDDKKIPPNVDEKQKPTPPPFEQRRANPKGELTFVVPVPSVSQSIKVGSGTLPSSVSSLALSRHGKFVVMGGKSISVYDTQNHRLSQKMEPRRPGGEKCLVAFSADGKFIATSTSEGGTVNIFSPPSCRSVGIFSVPKRLHCLQFSPDGKFVLAAGESRFLVNPIGLANPSLDVNWQKVDDSLGTMVATLFSRSSRYALSADNQGQVVLWGYGSGVTVVARSKKYGSMADADLSLDGKWGAFAGPSQVLLFPMDVSQGAKGEAIASRFQAKEYEVGHDIHRVAVSARGRFVAVARPDSGVIEIHDLEQRRLLKQLDDFGRPPSDLAFSSDDQRLFVCGGTKFRVYDTSAICPESNSWVFHKHPSEGKSFSLTNHTMSGVKNINFAGREVTTIATSPDGHFFAGWSEKTSAIVVVDTRTSSITQKVINDPKMGKSLKALLFSPDSQYLLASGRSAETQYVIDVKTLNMFRLPLAESQVSSAAFSPDSQLLYLVAQSPALDGNPSGWKVARVTGFRSGNAKIEWFATGLGSAGEIRVHGKDNLSLWEAVPGGVVRLRGTEGRLVNLPGPKNVQRVLSPQGDSFVWFDKTGTQAGLYVIRDAKRFTPWTLPAKAGEKVHAARYTHDGRAVVFIKEKTNQPGSRRPRFVSVYDARAGRELFTFQGPIGIGDARFVPDNNLLVLHRNTGVWYGFLRPKSNTSKPKQVATGPQKGVSDKNKTNQSPVNKPKRLTLGTLRPLRVSPSGRHVAAWDNANKQVKIIDLETKSDQTWTLEGYEKTNVPEVKFSPGSDRLFVYSGLADSAYVLSLNKKTKPIPIDLPYVHDGCFVGDKSFYLLHGTRPRRRWFVRKYEFGPDGLSERTELLSTDGGFPQFLRVTSDTEFSVGGLEHTHWVKNKIRRLFATRFSRETTDISPDGSLAVVGYRDNPDVLVMYTLSESGMVRKWQKSIEESLRQSRFTPEGKYVVSMAHKFRQTNPNAGTIEHRVIRIFRVADGTEVFQKKVNWSDRLDFREDTKTLYRLTSNSVERETIKLAKVESFDPAGQGPGYASDKSEKLSLAKRPTLTSAISPSGQCYACWDASEKKVILLNPQSGETRGVTLSQFVGSPPSFCFSQDSRHLLVCGKGSKTQYIVDVSGSVPKARSFPFENLVSGAFTPDGKTVFLLGRKKNSDGWLLAKASNQETLAPYVIFVEQKATSPLGLSVIDAEDFWVWDTNLISHFANGKRTSIDVKTAQFQDGWSVSPDVGAAWGSTEGPVAARYQLKDRELVKNWTFKADEDQLLSVRLSANGKVVICHARKGDRLPKGTEFQWDSIYLLSPRDGNKLFQVKVPQPITTVAFSSANGQLLACTKEGWLRWKLRETEEVSNPNPRAKNSTVATLVAGKTVPLGLFSPNSMTSSPDGRYLAFWARQRASLYVYDRKTKKSRTLKLSAYQQSSAKLTFSPDSTCLLVHDDQPLVLYVVHLHGKTPVGRRWKGIGYCWQGCVGSKGRILDLAVSSKRTDEDWRVVRVKRGIKGKHTMNTLFSGKGNRPQVLRSTEKGYYAYTHDKLYHSGGPIEGIRLPPVRNWRTVGVSEDGKKFAMGSPTRPRQVVVYALGRPNFSRVHKLDLRGDESTLNHFSGDGKYLLCVSRVIYFNGPQETEHTCLQLFDAETGVELAHGKTERKIEAAVVLPGGQWIVTATAKGYTPWLRKSGK
ncbi:MAG: hypothetical protein ACFCD0_12960 [Gemmataceae bacterium]